MPLDSEPGRRQGVTDRLRLFPRLPRHWPDRVGTIAGMFLTIQGVLAVIALRTGQTGGVFRLAVPMEPAAAIAFAVSGPALLALSRGARMLAMVLALAPALIGLTGLAAETLPPDWHPERVIVAQSLAHDPFATRELSRNAALVFFLLGSSFAFLWKRALSIGPLVVGTLGSISWALGVLAIVSSIPMLSSAAEWGYPSRMLGRTAAGLLVMSIGVTALAWRDGRHGESASKWLPLLTGVAIITGTVYLWAGLRSQELATLSLAVEIETTSLVSGLEKEIAGCVEKVSRLASRTERALVTRGSTWDYDSALQLSASSGLIGITWLDANRTPVQSVTLGQAPLPLVPLAGAQDSFSLAASRREPVVCPWLEDAGGEKWFRIVAPLTPLAAPPGGQSRVVGYMVGLCRLSAVLMPLFSERSARGFACAVTDLRTPRGPRTSESGDTPPQWIRERIVKLPGARWRARVWPGPQFLRRQVTLLPSITLFAGLALAMLVSIMLELVQITQVRARALFREVGERLKVEVLLAHQAEELTHTNTELLGLSHVLENAVEGIARIDADGKYLTVNRAFSSMLGRDHSGDTMVGMDWLSVIHPEDRERAQAAHARMVEAGKGEVEVKAVRVDGSQIYLHLVMIRPESTEALLSGHFCFGKDITERRRAAEHTLSSLREKEVLLKEIHHRVKNNLQVISSLLSLQNSHVKDPVASALFREAQNRIKSIALVHEKIYQSESLADLDFPNYIRNLASYLFRSYNISSGAVRLTTDVDEVRVDLDTSISLALILNELVSNALKYAFPEGRAGTVSIAFKRLDDGSHELSVADDGVGLPPGFDPGQSGTLGFHLVMTLADTVGGTVHVSSEGGARIAIRIEELGAAT